MRETILEAAKRRDSTVLTADIREDNFKGWIELFRSNIDVFMEDYLGMRLYEYQRLLVRTMHNSRSSTIIAARATAKSFLVGAYANAMAILYPGLQIVLVAPTKEQAGLLIGKKIRDELYQVYPNIAKEISDIKDSYNEQKVDYYNGSCIFVRAANEGARGARGQIIIFEECAGLSKKIVDEIFKPMTSYRNIMFKGKEEYKHYQTDKEFSRRIFITSAPWRDDSWVAEQAEDSIQGMLNGNMSNKFLAFDWVLAAKHIKPLADIADDKKSLGRIAFMREYENIIPKIVEGGAFTGNEIESVRLAKLFPYYPRETIAKIINDPTYIDDGVGRGKTNINPKIFELPDIKGERRLLSVDVAQVAGKNLSIIACWRFYPMERIQKDKVKGYYYRRDIMYMKSMSGVSANNQALAIRRLFADFGAEEVVIDVNIAGRPVAEALGQEIYDEERNKTYYPLKPFKGTDDDLTSKADPSGVEAIYPIVPKQKTNQDFYYDLKKAFSEKKIRLLNNRIDAMDLISTKVPEFSILNSEQRQLLTLPFDQTDEYKAELLQLKVTPHKTGISVDNATGGRKDRYSATSYGNYRIEMLEREKFGKKRGNKLEDYTNIVLK